ncbi:MAG: DNA polymerase I [Myxococcota bacterium]
MSAPKLHLIDGSGYIFRAFYAVRNLSTAGGEPTNAIYGFSQMLEKTLREEKPTHLALVFDSGEPTFRNEIYPAYKANRDAPPEELVEQVPKIHDLVTRFGITTLVEKGVEADDVIATLTRRALESGFEVRIITGDKDLMQLVSDRVELWEPMKGKRYDAAQVAAYDRLLVPPEKVRDALALAGDSSDNIPGVKGVGPKKAAKLLTDFGDLESILAAAAEGKVKGKMGETLASSGDDARLSLRLVTLKDDVELPQIASMDDLVYSGPNKGAIRELYEQYEFRRTTPRVDDEEEAAPVETPVPEGSAPRAANILIEHDRYVTVQDANGLAELVTHLEEAEHVGVAVEMSTPRAVDNALVGLGFAWAPGHAAYVPLGHAEGEQLGLTVVLEATRSWFGDARRKKSCAEGKLLAGLLEREGAALKGQAFDPTLAAYLLEPDEPGNDSDAISRRYLGHDPIPRMRLVTDAKKKRRPFPMVSIEAAAPYVAERAEIAWHAVPVMGPILDEAEVRHVMEDVELPLVPVLARMERAGVAIDVPRLSQLETRFAGELEKLEAACYEAAGKEFNIGSPKQLRTILYEELGLKITKTTKTGPSTDHAALEAIADDHPLPALVIQHRTVQKLQNTYVEALPKMVSPASGRVHTQLNQATAGTGRLSSSEPNLQNIPIRTDLGRELRKVFIPEPGRLLVSVDYSQVELRVLAHFSEDPVLVKAFEERADVHTRTAAALFEIDPADVNREQRTQAKAVNFGVLYGMGPVRLARELKIPRRTASQFVKDYFDRQPGVRAYIEETLERARNEGEVRTLLGRRRLVPDVHSRNRAAKSAAERVAVNTPIQGSAADLIKMAMLRVDALLRDAFPQAKLLLQVHDELLVEAPEEDAEAVAGAVRDAMQRVYPLAVPLDAEAHFGGNWDDAH